MTDPDLFSYAHARASDPATSHEAAESIDITKQAKLILQSYRDGSALLDVDAYRRAGFPPHACDGQRCSDLRTAGFIERTGARADAVRQEWVSVPHNSARARLSGNPMTCDPTADFIETLRKIACGRPIYSKGKGFFKQIGGKDAQDLARAVLNKHHVAWGWVLEQAHHGEPSEE